jgi:hypothetical protein
MTQATSSRARRCIGDPLARLPREKPPVCNGWNFSRYRDQAGKLVPVGALRKRYLETKSGR